MSVVVSSATAGGITIFSLLVMPSRQKRLAVEFAKLKYELEQEQIEKDLARQRNRDVREAVEQAVTISQKIRDYILMVNLSDKNYDRVSGESLEILSADITAFSDLFAKTFQQLDEFERKVLHDMKGVLFHVRTWFFSYENRTMGGWDKMEFLTCLMDLRSELFTLQNTLILYRQRSG